MKLRHSDTLSVRQNANHLRSVLRKRGKLGFGLLQDGNVGIRTLPKIEKVLIRLPSLGNVLVMRIGFGESKLCQWIERGDRIYTAMVQNLLKLHNRSVIRLRLQISETTNIDRRQAVQARAIGLCDVELPN